ncbi:MAG: 3D domain-containing protein [Actinobacteria bacterium]|nr:3D domain-containing protein [Actinomycetota bacterium]
MLKKYNIAVNVLFWIIIAMVITIVIFWFAVPGFKIPSYLFAQGNANTLNTSNTPPVEKVPIIVTKYLPVEKNVEWFYFVATAYTKNDDGQGTSNKTSTGKKPSEGIIAVDPEIIPYGTRVEIKNMGFFVAEDCGGKIKGNRIDIYFDTIEEAKKFGKKGLWLRFVDSPMMLAEENFIF